jgi:predicted enzyme related to lactoylglutathione lyase
MPNRPHPPVGAPCWTDLFTSDVEGSRRFYGELFGWEPQAPNDDFAGYFMWTREGRPIAGGMGDMPDLPATNVWTVYLATDDITRAAKTAEGEGAQITAGPMPIADLGSQAILTDPTGAHVGMWQPGTFPGIVDFDVPNAPSDPTSASLAEPGAPSWFELHTRDHARAISFYRTVFGWDTVAVGDTDEFRYTIARARGEETDLAGVMDASAFLPAGTSPYWSVYWSAPDVDAAVAKATGLGGSVVDPAQDTPYGRLATLADPSGAIFKLRGLSRAGQ